MVKEGKKWGACVFHRMQFCVVTADRDLRQDYATNIIIGSMRAKYQLHHLIFRRKSGTVQTLTPRPSVLIRALLGSKSSPSQSIYQQS